MTHWQRLDYLRRRGYVYLGEDTDGRRVWKLTTLLAAVREQAIA